MPGRHDLMAAMTAMPTQAPPTALLASRAGLYRECLPAAPLRRHFRRAWIHRVAADLAAPIAIVPDGCVDLIWHQGRLIAVGPDVTAAHPRLLPGSSVIGLRFQPGAGRHWFGLPLSDLVGQGIDLADLWSSAADDLAAAVSEEANDAAKLARLQAGLMQRLGQMAEPDATAGFIFRRLQGTRPAKLDRLTGELGISGRSLRRQSHALFGYGPKMLERILRFQSMLRLARATAEPQLAGLAADAGYADQAHLSREVRELAGMSAGTLLRQLTTP